VKTRSELVEFANVRFELPQNGGMTGTFELVYTRPDFKGTDRVYAKIRDMYRDQSPSDY
jgi:hypothetical protein